MKNKVTVVVTPVSGTKPKPKEVEIALTGTSVEEVLAKSKIAYDKNSQFVVDGEPAKLNTHVKPGAQVSVTEKVRGS